MHQQPQLHTATQGIRGMQNGKTPVKMANLEKEDSQTWKEAVPAAASEETPFKVPVISDVALQAGVCKTPHPPSPPFSLPLRPPFPRLAALGQRKFPILIFTHPFKMSC